MFGQVIEATFVILILGLILAHAEAFSTAVRSVGQLFTGSVQTLSKVAG